jgi:uncharacterized protein
MTKPLLPPDDSAGFYAQLKTQFQAQMPTRATLQQQRWLGPWAHRIAEHDLWHMKTESMARGVAIGIFWAFVVPFAQILFAAVHCVWWRGNIPLAAGVTLITNPFTIGGWLYLAYQTGSLFITAPAVAPTNRSGFFGMVESFGWPTLLGMGIFAVGGAALGYVLVRLGSAAWFHYRVARRARRRSAQGTS